MTLAAAKSLPRIFYFLAVVLPFVFFSCSTVKNYPDKPFVYQTNITVNGKVTAETRKDLESRLQQQLHDSVLVRRKQTLGFWNTLKNPPVYDSSNADKSMQYMQALLNSLGY